MAMIIDAWHRADEPKNREARLPVKKSGSYYGLICQMRSTLACNPNQPSRESPMELIDEGAKEHALDRFVDELAEMAEQGEGLRTQQGPISDPWIDFFGISAA
jgi:hypothetical protein